jgi:hypothetical protein
MQQDAEVQYYTLLNDSHRLEGYKCSPFSLEVYLNEFESFSKFVEYVHPFHLKLEECRRGNKFLILGESKSNDNISLLFLLPFLQIPCFYC